MLSDNENQLKYKIQTGTEKLLEVDLTMVHIKKRLSILFITLKQQQAVYRQAFGIISFCCQSTVLLQHSASVGGPVLFKAILKGC